MNPAVGTLRLLQVTVQIPPSILVSSRPETGVWPALSGVIVPGCCLFVQFSFVFETNSHWPRMAV